MTETTGILYLEEHTSCYNYRKCIREGFLYYKFRSGETHEEVSENDCILFVMEGELEVSCNGERRILSDRSMVCFGRGNRFRIHSPGNGRVVIAQFDNAMQSCEKMSFSRLYSLNIRSEGGIYPLEIRHRLQSFLELLVGYLRMGPAVSTSTR